MFGDDKTYTANISIEGNNLTITRKEDPDNPMVLRFLDTNSQYKNGILRLIEDGYKTCIVHEREGQLFIEMTREYKRGEAKSPSSAIKKYTLEISNGDITRIKATPPAKNIMKQPD